MPEYVVWRVCQKKKEKNGNMKNEKIGIHWPEKATSTSYMYVVDTRLKLVVVNSSALQAVEWSNPSTSCYG